MTRISKSALLMGVAVMALAACSSAKGPGEIGTKNDIVVRNNGLPGSQPPLPGGDVIDPAVASSNDPLALPPASVEQGQPLPDTSPEVEAAVQAEEESRAPLASTTSEPMSDPADPLPPTASEAAIPEEPVTSTATTTPAQAPVVPPSSVYPIEDYPAQAAAPAQTPVEVISPRPEAAPAAATSPNAYVPVPAGSAYPLDPNAPYSPSAMAGRTSSAAQTVVTPPAIPAPVAPAVTPPPAAPVIAAPTTTPSLSLNDPILIRSAQAALKAKGVYAGAENGTIDAAFLNALTAYQSQNRLPVGGLNMETLKSLNVIE